jgi:hypothetical protein
MSLRSLRRGAQSATPEERAETDINIEQNFGTTIDLFGSGKAPPGVDFVETTFAQPGQPQTYFIEAADLPISGTKRELDAIMRQLVALTPDPPDERWIQHTGKEEREEPMTKNKPDALPTPYGAISADTAGRLHQEIKDILAENERLRRRVEDLERQVERQSKKSR